MPRFIITGPVRRLLWRRRVAAVRAWQNAARQDACRHNAAVARIVDMTEDAPGLSPGRLYGRDPDRHDPDRSTWDCRCCGKPWPCVAARDRLASQLDRPALGMYLGIALHHAAAATPAATPAQLHERFLSWIPMS